MVTDTTNPAAKLDAYELRHLVSHLEFAKREDDLHRLLSLETVGKKNAWYEAKETAGDLQGYLVDVNQAWKLIQTKTYTLLDVRESSELAADGYIAGAVNLAYNSGGLQSGYTKLPKSKGIVVVSYPLVFSSAG